MSETTDNKPAAGKPTRHLGESLPEDQLHHDPLLDCLLMGWEEEGRKARVLFPDAGQGSVSLDREAIEARYAGIAIFARPHFRFDQRTPQVGEVVQRHWFWGTFLEQMPVYRDVLMAAAIINVLALAMPLFVMNVYDRVVPNFAVETLWMLAAGILLVLGIDYTLRLLRGHFVDLAGARIDHKLSALIMERVLGMRMADRPASVGSFAATLRSFESVRDFIASATITALIDWPFALLFLLVIAWISWPLVFVPVLGAIAMLIYSYVIQHKMHELSETTYRASALRNATLIESLTALETIKAHGAEGQMQAKWEKTAAFLARVSAELRLLSSSAFASGINTQTLTLQSAAQKAVLSNPEVLQRWHAYKAAQGKRDAAACAMPPTSRASICASSGRMAATSTATPASMNPAPPKSC